ncbi:MAG: hypothetical protein ACJ8AD_13295, partial [Gemmatimonadaceae bacterium]
KAVDQRDTNAPWRIAVPARPETCPNAGGDASEEQPLESGCQKKTSPADIHGARSETGTERVF